MSDLAAASPLTDAILANDLSSVAELLDRNPPIGEPELMALVKLAWAHRGPKEEAELVEAAEDARQIYTLLAEAGANLTFQTSRGRIVDRIVAVQPEWPSAKDRAPVGPQITHEVARTPEEHAAPEFPAPRAARGAMHRRPR